MSQKQSLFVIALLVLIMSVLGMSQIVRAQEDPDKPDKALRPATSYAVAPYWVYVGPLPNTSLKVDADTVAPYWVYTGHPPSHTVSVDVAPHWVYVGPLPGMRPVQ